MDDLREFLFNEDGMSPELADLPYWWEQIPPDQRATDMPKHRERDVLISCYSNWAFTKPWAWEGLRRLLETLMERREPIPEALQCWANAAASGQRKPPGTGRGRPQEGERNARIMHAFRVLQSPMGCTQEQAIDLIADAVYLSPDGVRSVIRKVRGDHPFR